MTIYSSIAGLEIPEHSIYLMLWNVARGINYGVLINTEGAEEVEIVLYSEKFIRFTKNLTTIRDQTFVIDEAHVPVDDPIISPLLESKLYLSLDEDEQAKVSEMIRKIILYNGKVASSSKNLDRMQKSILTGLEENPLYTEELKVFEKNQKFFTKYSDALTEYVSAHSKIKVENEEDETALATVGDARKWPEWSSEMDYQFIRISDPDFNEDLGMGSSNDSEDNEEEVEEDDDMEVDTSEDVDLERIPSDYIPPATMHLSDDHIHDVIPQ